MTELESVIEDKLIKQLCNGDSQWTYRPDIRNEEEIWNNFKYILEQNNKAKLNDIPLSESEFAKIKNDVSHASFYDAGKWMTGENGKVYVHVQRGNETLHLVVMNNEHIAGGSSVYEVINQYQAFKVDDLDMTRNRRFDISLLINGIPMIHIELKNKNHSYKEGYNQIKKYIAEGKFRGIYSNVQMFVVSNFVHTKYFSAARDTELRSKFLTGWLDSQNRPVDDLNKFTESVLRIPMAHEMATKYTVLDNDKKKLLILRPYQIHAIEAMRNASKHGKSGFIWHTTGSGKTMTSYKATRNLLMDIPSIEKTIFLIDRKDLDLQTKMAFQSYAENDTIEVDDTERVDTLIQKMVDGNRQMIVTTRQKMQTMIKKKLKEGTKQYDKIKSLKIAFVVDECHRAVTPETKRLFEEFFCNSLWFGFTGTPIFEDNKYEQKGDLPQTTEQLYGECLHSYTIKEAIHDEAVLGFMIENLGTKNISVEEEMEVYNSEEHMRKVLDVILNHSYEKLGLQRSKGQAFEGMLTVSSIAVAQKYYDLLKRVKDGTDELKISEKIHKALPDFPKFAITYSVSENDESSKVNQDKMKESLLAYNRMFETNFQIEEINAYNSNLNDRLARKEKRYMDRSQQLDLVIVVDRLLTGFDAPCLSTLYMDRQPMSPQNLIQAFSRTNRLFDEQKQYGQIVTFQSPKEFKEAINNALKLYSRGGDGNPIAEDWETIRQSFAISLKAVRMMMKTPEDSFSLSKEQKKGFVHLFQALDHDFAHLKAFSLYNERLLDQYDFSDEEYENYAAMYNNFIEELRSDVDDPDSKEGQVVDDYELIAYSKLKVDFEYIVELIQDVIDSGVWNENLRESIESLAQDNPKLGALLTQIADELARDTAQFVGQDISLIIHRMRTEAIDREVKKFSKKWFVNTDDVKYEVYNYRDGTLANENKLKENANYTVYKESVTEPMNKIKFRKNMIEEFKYDLMDEIGQLID